MSEGLRWKLALGCLLLAALEAPGSALVLVQDLEGPWRTGPGARGVVSARSLESASVIPPRLLQPSGADVPVAPEALLAIDRSPAPRLDPRPVAVLVAR